MTLVRHLPRLVTDRLGRLGLFLGAAALLLAPALRAAWLAGAPGGGAVGEGLRDGLAVAGRHPLAGLLGLSLAVGAFLLFEGIVSRPRRSGEYRVVLSRPISRPAYYLACWVAALLCLTVGGAALGAAAAWAGGGLGRPPGPAGTAAASVLYAFTLGAPLFLASAWMDNGEAILVAALALLPTALERLALTGSRVAEAAGGWLAPLLPRLDPGPARDALLAGRLPEAGDALPPLGYGVALLAAALLSIRLRDHRGR